MSGTIVVAQGHKIDFACSKIWTPATIPSRASSIKKLRSPRLVDFWIKQPCILLSNGNFCMLRVCVIVHIVYILQALKDLHLTFEVKQRAIGVPVEELCAKPSESSHVEKPALFLDILTQNPLSS